jgi:transcriptional regulator with XRE-family HTH domain
MSWTSDLATAQLFANGVRGRGIRFTIQVTRFGRGQGVPALRRGEVATLAGVSVEYYSKLERGALGGVSASVLDSLARALQLDDAERAHLFHLAHAADGTSAGMRPRRRPSPRWTPRPALLVRWVRG